ncbi:hypothetical protein [Streptomyces sp. SYSU K217416]
MTVPLPHRVPDDSSRNHATPDNAHDWESFGMPSPALVARSERGLINFLRRAADQAEETDE